MKSILTMAWTADDPAMVKALDYLAKSIKYGAHDIAFIQKDGRLWKLHDDPRFAKLVGPMLPLTHTPAPPAHR